MIENYLNLLHYCFYRGHYKMHLFANKVNPFRLLTKIPFIKQRLENKGITNIQMHIDNAFGDRNFGLSVIVAGGLIWGMIGLFFISILIIANFEISILPIVICIILSFLISHFFIFKKNKYLVYFKKYDRWSKKEKKKSFSVTLLSIAILLLTYCIAIKD